MGGLCESVCLLNLRIPRSILVATVREKRGLKKYF